MRQYQCNQLEFPFDIFIFHDTLHRTEANGLRFFVDDLEFVFFEHRLAPEAVNSLYISGRIKIYNVIYKSPKVRLNLS